MHGQVDGRLLGLDPAGGVPGQEKILSPGLSGNLLEAGIPAGRLFGPDPGQMSASFQNEPLQIRDGLEHGEHTGLEPAPGPEVGGSLPEQLSASIKEGKTHL